MGAHVSVIYLQVVRMNQHDGSAWWPRGGLLYVIILGIYNIQNVVIIIPGYKYE